MDEPLPTVGAGVGVAEAVAALRDADALLVQEDGRPVGVLTRQDLLGFVARDVNRPKCRNRICPKCLAFRLRTAYS